MPTRVSPERARQFAVRVVTKLRQAGYEALWAGGCVRDQLLGMAPADYDVATNATPEQVRACFGRRRTLAIGAAFGVITILGAKDEGQIEVATFRCDAAYSDGRHPDHVTFSTAREDALRRDFTMNGLFYDPITHEVIDFVGGQDDLAAGIVRAIGDPLERFAEDKLRMLRAARFTATFEFQLDPKTLAAIRDEARTITVVSAERIAAELRKMLAHPNRAVAAELLRQTSLLDAILPESRPLFAGQDAGVGSESPWWRHTLEILAALKNPTVRVALAAFLWGIHQHDPTPRETVLGICDRWKLSNHELKGTAWLLSHESMIRRAPSLPWPTIQRVLVSDDIDELLTLAEAVARQVDGAMAGIEFCRRKIQLPATQWNPPALITGDDLRQAGLRAGPIFRKILNEVRDAQLTSEITDRDQALAMARTIARREG